MGHKISHSISHDMASMHLPFASSKGAWHSIALDPFYFASKDSNAHIVRGATAIAR